MLENLEWKVSLVLTLSLLFFVISPLSVKSSFSSSTFSSKMTLASSLIMSISLSSFLLLALESLN